MYETMIDRIRRIDVLEHLRNDIQSLSHFVFINKDRGDQK